MGARRIGRRDGLRVGDRWVAQWIGRCVGARWDVVADKGPALVGVEFVGQAATHDRLFEAVEECDGVATRKRVARAAVLRQQQRLIDRS